jgi:hypothetical protein
MKMMCGPLGRVLLVLLCLSTPRGAAAQDLVLGVGRAAFDADRTTAVSIEYHAPEWRRFGRLGIGFGTGLVADDSGSLWIGVGVSGRFALGERWFGEFSVLPGYYDQGPSTTDLGGNFQVRSLIGLGYQISDQVGLSVAIDHRSNAGTAEFNPGVNTVSLRVRRRF